jgi:hypothetical protein
VVVLAPAPVAAVRAAAAAAARAAATASVTLQRPGVQPRAYLSFLNRQRTLLQQRRIKMKTFLTAVAITMALTFPVLAEGEPTGTEAAGEANGSFKHSAQQDNLALQSFAQAPISSSIRAESVTTPDHFLGLPSDIKSVDMKKMDKDLMKSPSGADGGNRK